MAVKLWVPASTVVLSQSGDTTIDGSALNKQTTVEADIDDAVRVSIAQPTVLWRLKCTAGTVTTEHGAITSVKLHARFYTSNQGPYSWDFSINNAFVAPYVKPPSSARKWSIPDWLHLPAQTFLGYSIDGTYGKNFNQAGEPPAKVVAWDITSLYTWGSDNSKLSGCEFGLAVDEADISADTGIFSQAGYMPIDGAAGSTPRWNVSQLILEVDANDPPPAPTRPLIILA